MALIRSSLYSYCDLLSSGSVRSVFKSLYFTESEYKSSKVHLELPNSTRLILTNNKVQYLHTPDYSKESLTNNIHVEYLLSKDFDISLFPVVNKKEEIYKGFKYFNKDGVVVKLIEKEHLLIWIYIEGEDIKSNEEILLKLSRDLIKHSIEMKKISTYIY